MASSNESRISTTLVSAALLIAAAGDAFARTVQIPFEVTNFSNGTVITNPYWPLTAFGGAFTYRALASDECEFNKISHAGETHLSTIDLDVAVLRDQAWLSPRTETGECDIANAVLEEDTIDYFAQDDDGNIWYLGEQTFTSDDESSECTDAGSWEAGLPLGDPETPPALPGIVMLADPRPGDRYQQELLEDEAEDWGAVLRLNASVSDGAQQYTNCLVTKEWTPLEPGSVEQKYYCLNPVNGPGLVLVKELKGKTLAVRFVGDDFPVGLPGDGDTFPSAALPCTVP